MGAPERVTICHCTFCHKLTGTGFLQEPIFNRDTFSHEGTVAQYVHSSDGSGAKVTVNFCGNCGTSLWLDLARFPALIGITGGTYDHPDWFPRIGATVRHIFTRSALAGVVLPSGVDLYREQAILPDGSAAEPFRLSEPLMIGSSGGLPDYLL